MKKYTRKQIVEAISYWKSMLNESQLSKDEITTLANDLPDMYNKILSFVQMLDMGMNGKDNASGLVSRYGYESKDVEKIFNAIRSLYQLLNSSPNSFE